MPYLDEDWDSIPAGTWVPETRREDWDQRGSSVTLRAAWTNVTGPTPEQVAQFDRLPEFMKDNHLAVLAEDMASAQRDGLFYFNAIERLKQEPTDEVADKVIENLKTLGFSSIGMPPSAGGPPPGKSPRPVRKALDWLSKQLAKVGRFLLNAVAFLTTQLSDLGLSAVALEIGWSPAVSVEFPANLFRDARHWGRAKAFLDKYLEEMGDKVFAL